MGKGDEPRARVIDFTEAERSPDEDARPVNSKGKLMTAKQVRSRARRTMMKGGKLSEEDFLAWAGKPVDEWDLEELAKGRPRDGGGGFRGAPPKFMPREVHERIADRFKLLVKGQMDGLAVSALGVVRNLLESEDYDDKGKPVVPPSVRLDAAKWLVEHSIGKPVQPTTSDVSVKLQGILGAVMVNPTYDDRHPDRQALPPGYSAAHFGTRGEAVIDVEGEWDDDD